MVNSNNNKNLNKQQIANMCVKVAKQVGVPVDLFLSLVKNESNFNPNARSSVGAIGLTQLMPGTATGLGVNAYNIEENLIGGARYLKQQLVKYKGNIAKALAAYNAGPGAVDKHNGIPPYKETQNYVKRIINDTKSFSKYGEGVTGEAAPVKDTLPIGERAENLQKDYTSLADRNIASYTSNPYDPSFYQKQRAQRVEEYLDLANKAYRETPMYPTQQELQDIQAPFTNVPQDIKEMQDKAIQEINNRTGEKLYGPYEAKLKQAYEEQIARAQAANPYTQLAQIAPVNLDEYAQAVAQQQAAEDYANNKRGVFAALDYMNPNVQDKSQIVTRDFAAEAQRRADLAQQLAQAQQAAQMARQTGLTPQQFIERGLMDRTAQDQALTRQNALLGSMYLAAMQGDVQAQQVIGHLIQTGQANVVNNAANQAKAMLDLYNQKREAQKERFNQIDKTLGYIGGLDATALSGANQVQQQNIASSSNIANTGMNTGVDAQRNMYNYESNFLPGQTGTNEDFKPITPQQYGSTRLNAAAMSNDPTAFGDALDTYNAIAAKYGQIDPRYIYGSNTFIPKQ